MACYVIGSTRFLAALLTIAMIVGALPMVVSEEPIVDNASAQGGIVQVGWVGEFMNWNPLGVEFVSDWVAYNLIYSTLFQYDEDWADIENHLAMDYYQIEWPAGNMSTFINISENAYFRDAAEPQDMTHPLTAHDVKFTFDLIQANVGNAWDYYLYNVTGTNVTDDGEPWDYSRTDNPYQVRIDTEYTKSTLIDDLVWVPILPKFEWETYTSVMASMNPMDLIGSGPFYYEAGQKNQWHDFATAPNFHGTTDYGEERTIDIDGIRYLIYTETSGLAIAINTGSVDVVDVTGAQKPVWDSIVEDDRVTKQVTQELGIYDIAINAIPEELRDAHDYAESGNKILLDPIVRKAIGMTLNKQRLKDYYFHGLPDVADTVLNPGFWHADLSNPLPFNTTWAKENLTANGYEDTDGDGYLEVTTDSLAYQEEWALEGDKLEFSLDVPESDPGYSTIGTAWVSWAEEAGIKFNFESYATGPITMNQWYECEYDLWVWSWYWGPEPLSNLACWLTNQIKHGGYNCVGPICEGGLDEENGWWWVDEENGVARCGFDETFEDALRTTDINDRKVLVDELQEAIYNTYTEFPPLHPNGLYAFSNERFVGWGDWESHVARTIISDMLWLWYDLEPAEGGNALPIFETTPQTVYDAEVGVSEPFFISVSDEEGDDIEVNWSAGDGSEPVKWWITDTSEQQNVMWEHTYDTVGTYTLRVGLSDEHHLAETVATAQVTVSEEENQAPYIEGLAVTPSIAYIGEETTWVVSASDHEQGEDGEGLLFTWDWGDGTYTTTLHSPVANDTLVVDEQTHSWDIAKSYPVMVSVWDGYDVDTNTAHNITTEFPGGFEVFENLPPTAPMAVNISGLEGQRVACEAVASDRDPDDLRFTWDWGDGTYNTTNHDTSSSPGTEVASSVKHEWSAAGTYPVDIWVDDGEGHNVSTTIYAVILAAGEEAPPGSISIRQSPNPGTVDVSLTLTVGASDANANALTVTIDFDDEGAIAVEETAGGTYDMQYVEFSHTYNEEDVYTVIVYVDDGTYNISTTKEVSVTANEPPLIALADLYSFYYNQSKQIRPVSLNDPDGDQLTVWYDWGDDTPMSQGDPDDAFAASHAYSQIGGFVLTAYADDGRGNNASNTANVMVYEANKKPSIEGYVERSQPAGEAFVPGEVIYFNVTVADEEGDNVTVTMDFGDGSDPEVVQFDAEPEVNKTVEFTHAYDEGRPNAYAVIVTVKDDQDHSDMTWASVTMSITVEEEATDDGGISTGLILGILAIVILALIAALILMKRKGKTPSTMGDMEGITQPEEEGVSADEAMPETPSDEPPPST